jgi:hypothetical protein
MDIAINLGYDNGFIDFAIHTFTLLTEISEEKSEEVLDK